MTILYKIAKILGFKTTNAISKNQNIVIGSNGVNIQNIDNHYAAPEQIGLKSKQVLTIEAFVKEYENSKLATPISNEFFGRETEIIDLLKSIENNKITIVTGSGGLGKTRLCREVLSLFEKENPDFASFCIVNKFDSIYADLRYIFDSNKKCIIFIDDANRQSQHLSQLLAIMREPNLKDIRLLITVRDYAVNHIKNTCLDYGCETVNIEKMTDEMITSILGSDNFGIKNQTYVKKILSIADGNPRLAIMAALVALEKQNIDVLNNVSDVFELYFSTYLNDHKELNDPHIRKILGLIGFFYVIDLDNEEFYTPLIERFSIDVKTFRQSIDLLENLELIGYSEDKNAIRISEQNLGNYFFYCCFIRDSLLSFETLINYYFETHNRRFTEGVVSANNHFGEALVRDKLTPILRTHLLNLEEDKTPLKEKILKTFWFYLPDETLAYVSNELTKLESPNTLHFKTEYDNRLYWHERDNSYLELISPFIQYPFATHFEIAIELGFENVRKQPELMPKWIKKLTDRVGFEHDDAYNDFFRQTKLFEVVISNAQAGKLEYVTAFFPLAEFFLKTEYQVHKSERNFKVTFYQYPLPFNETVRAFRAKIWKSVGDNYELNTDASNKILTSTHSFHSKKNPQFIGFDLSYTLPLISQKMNPNEVQHCLLVHGYCANLKNFEGIETEELIVLKKQFTNQKFEWLSILDKNKYRNKKWYEFDFEDDYEKFIEAKKKEIDSYCDFKNLSEFQSFYKIYLELINTNNSIARDLAWSLDVILNKHWTTDADLCISFLSWMLLEDNLNGYTPHLVFWSAFDNQQRTIDLFRLANNFLFKEKDYWLMHFFDIIPENLLNVELYEGFIDRVKKFDLSVTFHRETIKKFATLNPSIYSEWLKIVTDKIRNENKLIHVWYDFFEHSIEYFTDEDLPLVKELYLAQNAQQQHYDLGHKDFLAILKRDNSFLKDFIKFEHGDDQFKQGDSHTNLGIIWELENAEFLVEEAIILSRSLVIVCMSPFEFYANVFFYGVKTEFNERVKQFFLDFVTKYSDKYKLMQVIFNIVKTSFNGFYETLFKHFLKLNHNSDDFEKIKWEERTGGLIAAGGTIFGEIAAHELKKILKWVDEMPNPLKYINHKAILQQRISNEENYAKVERRRNFSKDDF